MNFEQRLSAAPSIASSAPVPPVAARLLDAPGLRFEIGLDLSMFDAWAHARRRRQASPTRAERAVATAYGIDNALGGLDESLQNAQWGEMVDATISSVLSYTLRCETLPAKDWMFAQDTLTTEFSAVDQAFAVGASTGYTRTKNAEISTIGGSSCSSDSRRKEVNQWQTMIS